jgi:hypothetical protein
LNAATASTGARGASARTAERSCCQHDTRHCSPATADQTSANWLGTADQTSAQHGRQKHQCKDCGTGHCEHGRQRGKCKDRGTGHCQHRAPEAPVQGMSNAATASTSASGASARTGNWHCRSNEAAPMQGLRHGPLRARAPAGQVQGLRHGPLPARAPEAPVQGMLNKDCANFQCNTQPASS